MSKAVFLDLNGTLVEPILVDHPSELRAIPGSSEGVAALCQRDFICPVVTVQSRIEKGAFTEAEFLTWFHRFAQDLAFQGAVLCGPYVCPHRFHTPCDCEKPNTLLYERAAAELDIRLHGAFVIGDAAADMEAASRFGGRGCLVRSGWAANGAEVTRALPYASYVARDFGEAIAWVLSHPAA